MSRTYRNNFHSSYFRSNPGSKLGKYVICDRVMGGKIEEILEEYPEAFGFFSKYYWIPDFATTYFFRLPKDKHEEWRRHKRWIHGEHGPNDVSPNKWLRKNRMRQNRSINKRELAKWLKNEYYEPLFEEEPRSHLWDWR